MPGLSGLRLLSQQSLRHQNAHHMRGFETWRFDGAVVLVLCRPRNLWRWRAAQSSFWGNLLGLRNAGFGVSQPQHSRREQKWDIHALTHGDLMSLACCGCLSCRLGFALQPAPLHIPCSDSDGRRMLAQCTAKATRMR
jgi:hypothetical protein